MMRLPPFRYLAPRTAREAARILADNGPEAMAVAGGTDLYPNMKRRQFTPKVLVGLRGLAGAAEIHANGDLRLGALATLTEVSGSAVVSRRWPAVARSAGLVSSPPLRNAGTIGGNLCVDTRCNYYNQSEFWRASIGYCMKKDGDICLVAPGSKVCWALSSSDTAPVLWSMGATVTLSGPGGERRIPIAGLYQDDGIVYLSKRPDEVLTEIALPPAGDLRSAYLKLRRRGSFDFPVLGVAAALRMDGDVVREARIVLGAVASLPREAVEAGALLAGRRLTAELIDEAAGVASRPSKPLDNTDLTHPYRKKMTRVFVTRALRRLAGLPERADDTGAGT